MARTQISGNLADIAFWRGDRGYEQARRGEMWNARVPERYPAVVVRPRSDEDVVAAVRLAGRIMEFIDAITFAIHPRSPPNVWRRRCPTGRLRLRSSVAASAG
jgi:hypothetical protein